VIDQLFARIDSGTAYWELTDREGSVRDVTDNTGVVKDTLVYDAFGNITSETDSTKRGHFAWTGREFDKENGLQYSRGRDYNPKPGRFQQEDPLGLTPDVNRYRYIHNMPTGGTDPSGFEPYLDQFAVTSTQMLAAGAAGGHLALAQAGVAMWGAHLQRFLAGVERVADT